MADKPTPQKPGPIIAIPGQAEQPATGTGNNDAANAKQIKNQNTTKSEPASTSNEMVVDPNAADGKIYTGDKLPPSGATPALLNPLVPITVQGPKGDKGDPGPKGPKGDPGDASDIDEDWIREIIASMFNLKKLRFIEPVTEEIFGTKQTTFQVEFLDILQQESEVVTPTWTVSDITKGIISHAGLFTAADVTENQTVTITATYTDPFDDKVYTVSTDLLIKPFIPVLLTVAGPSSLTGPATASYSATVKYSNDATAVVTGSIFTVWEVTNPAIGTLTSNQLSAPQVNQNTAGAVKASYTERGITVTGQQNVTILPRPIVPYYGVAPVPDGYLAMNDAALQTFVNSLSGRGPNPNRLVPEIALPQGPGEYLWYAAPVSYGNPDFVDLSTSLRGGWDSAILAVEGPIGAGGPRTFIMVLNGQNMQFNLWRTDHSNLGNPPQNRWAVQ